MKKYLLIGNVLGIGGWQLYTEARAEFLLNNNIIVYVLTEESSNKLIKLNGFKKQKIIYIDEIFRPIYIYTKKQINKIVNRLLQSISFVSGDEIQIEATNITTTLWGEYIAKKTNGINISYILQSHIKNISINEQIFLKFKYDLNMLYGMSKLTIPDIFKDYFEPGNDVRELLASWKSPICENNERIEEIDYYKKQDNIKVIGYFGNLAKPHFIKLCCFLKRYCEKYPNITFIFLSIGSSSNGIAEEKQKILSKNINNIKCINIPSLYPVPRSFFSYMDVCLGSWGSSTIAAKAGVISIRFINDIEIIPHGIIGITLIKKPYYENPKCQESLDELLDEILFKKRFFNISPIIEKTTDDNESIQKKIHNVLCPSSGYHDIKYYDVLKIPIYGNKNRILRLLNIIFGVNKTRKIIWFINALYKK